MALFRLYRGPKICFAARYPPSLHCCPAPCPPLCHEPLSCDVPSDTSVVLPEVCSPWGKGGIALPPASRASIFFLYASGSRQWIALLMANRDQGVSSFGPHHHGVLCGDDGGIAPTSAGTCRLFAARASCQSSSSSCVIHWFLSNPPYNQPII